MTLPDRLVSLVHHAHDIAKRQTNAESTPSIPFDMAICNVYHLQRPSDRLGGHQDDVESDLSLPLVTVSLGAPGIFLLGGRSRQDVPTAILLRAGDCMILSGNSRGYFHGVPSVLSNELDNDLSCCQSILCQRIPLCGNSPPSDKNRKVHKMCARYREIPDMKLRRGLGLDQLLIGLSH